MARWVEDFTNTEANHRGPLWTPQSLPSSPAEVGGRRGGGYFWKEHHEENERPPLTTPRMILKVGSNHTYDTPKTADYSEINIPRKTREQRRENHELIEMN